MKSYTVSDILDYTSDHSKIVDPFVITESKDNTYTIVHLSDGFKQSQLTLNGDNYYLRKDLMWERQLKELLSEV